MSATVEVSETTRAGSNDPHFFVDNIVAEPRFTISHTKKLEDLIPLCELVKTDDESGSTSYLQLKTHHLFVELRNGSVASIDVVLDKPRLVVVLKRAPDGEVVRTRELDEYFLGEVPYQGRLVKMKAVPSPDRDLFGNIPKNVLRGEASFEKRLFEEVRQYLMDIWVAAKPVDYTIVASIIMASYVRELYPAAPFLFLVGQHGWGKSTFMELLNRLCFLTVSATDISVPSLGDIDNIYHPFILQDECQQLNNTRDTDNSVKVAVYNNRYKAGGKRIKLSDASPGHARKVVVQNLYGFTAFAGLSTPGTVSTEDRAIELASVRGTPKISLYSEEAQARAEIIRCRLMTFRTLHVFDETSSILEKFSDLDYTGRLREILLPSLHIASLVGKEVEAEVRRFALSFHATRQERETTNPQSEVMEAYAKCLLDSIRSGKPVDVEVKRVTEEYNRGRDVTESKTPQDIGRILTTLSYGRRKSNGVKVVSLDRALVRNHLDSFDLWESLMRDHADARELLAETPSVDSQNSLDSLNSPNSLNNANSESRDRENGEDREIGEIGSSETTESPPVGLAVKSGPC